MNAKKALEQIAKREGVSVEIIRREIEIAMADAWRNPDSHVQALWAAIPHAGEHPTPEECITYLAHLQEPLNYL